MKYLIENINKINFNEINTLYENLSTKDKKNIDKIIDKKKKKQTIIGKILLKELLKENYKIDYDDITIRKNKNGKPYIKDKDIYYNISHSEDYVICVISDKRIGVDIEKIRKLNKNNIKFFATKKEQDYINEKDFNKRALRVYTLKEAYCKMLGKNMNIASKIEFDIKENTITHPNINIYTIADIKEYIISICEEKK